MKLQKFRAGFGRVVTGIGYISLVVLFMMVIVVTVDVVLRKMTGSTFRIDGSNEITAFSMIIVCSLWIPALQIKKGHIWVPLFVDKFPYRFRCFWLFAIRLIETGLIALFAIGAYRRLLDLYSTGRATDVLKMPWWIFAVFLLIAFIEYFVISLIDSVQYCIDGAKNKPPAPKAEGWSEDEVKGI